MGSLHETNHVDYVWNPAKKMKTASLPFAVRRFQQKKETVNTVEVNT